MYQILLNQLEKPKFDACLEGSLLDSKGQLTPSIFGNGQSVKSIADKRFSIEINEAFSEIGKLRDRLSVCVHSSVDLFVVSEKAQQLLNEMAYEQIELCPFYFTYNNQHVSNYKIVNVLNKIDCINYEESEIDFECYDNNDVGQGAVYTIDSLILNSSLIPEHMNIFLLGNHNDSIIIVHERLVKKIKDLSLSGFVFCKPEDFQL